MKAQKVLSSCFDTFLYSARRLMDSIVMKLKPDPGVSHEQFKVSVIGDFYHKSVGQEYKLYLFLLIGLFACIIKHTRALFNDSLLGNN